MNLKTRAMADHHPERFFAEVFARGVLVFCVLLLCVLGGLSFVEKNFSVPSLAPKLLKEKVEIAWVQIKKPQKIEHVVEKSEFKIPTPPEKIPPKKEAPKPKAIPKTKKQIQKEEILDVAPSVENTDFGGEKETPHDDFGNAEDLKNQALAFIIQTIEKNKHYPRRARQMGLSGKVILKITIQQGIILHIDFQQKNQTEMLNQAAMLAAEKLKGKTLPFQGDLVVNVPVEFSLKDF